MLGEAVVSSVGGAVALMAYAVRAPSSSLFGPSIHQGSAEKRSIALTFDDGPSEATPEIVTILNRYRISATFFVCGANVRRLPATAIDVVSAGHEIGNHTDTHPYLCFRSADLITREFAQAQLTIKDVLGLTPSLMRAPFGVRWFGFRSAQRHLDLLGVMWSVIGNDWKLDPPGIAARLLKGARNGAIFCLHDGRELRHTSRHSSTGDALRLVIPKLLDQGFQFETVSRILCPKN